MSVTIEQIKAFRQATGYKLSDCKEALEATNGDTEKAKEYVVDKWKKKTKEW